MEGVGLLFEPGAALQLLGQPPGLLPGDTDGGLVGDVPGHGDAHPSERPDGEADMLGAPAAVQLHLADAIDVNGFSVFFSSHGPGALIVISKL